MTSYLPRPGDRPLILYRPGVSSCLQVDCLAKKLYADLQLYRKRERRQNIVDIRRWLYQERRQDGIDYDEAIFNEDDIISPWSHFSGHIRLSDRFCREYWLDRRQANPPPANPPPASAPDAATVSDEAALTANPPPTDPLPSFTSPVLLEPASHPIPPPPPTTSANPFIASRKGTSVANPIAIDNDEDDAAVIALPGEEAFKGMGG